MEEAIDWDPIEKVFTEEYEPGQNKVGHPASRPLMLFKCLLLQKWFRVDSGPELESQINDSRVFRTFLDLAPGARIPGSFNLFSFQGEGLTKGNLTRLPIGY